MKNLFKKCRKYHRGKEHAAHELKKNCQNRESDREREI